MKKSMRHLESANLWLDSLISRYDKLDRDNVIRILIYFCREMQIHTRGSKYEELFKAKAEKLWNLKKG